MYAKPTSPQSIGQVLDGSFRLTAAAFGRSWILALFAGISGYAASVYQFTRGDSLAEAVTAPQDAMYWTLYAVGLLASVLFYAAIYLRIDSIADGSTGAGALQSALRKLPLLIALIILNMLALMVGFILLIVPGLILIVSLVLAMPILLLEDKGPIDSLTSSHKLVWGNWWRTAAILTVGGIIIFVLYMILGLIAAAVAPFLAGGEAAVVAVVSLFIVLALAGILISPYFVSLILNIYWDLKLRREGGDLSARAEAV
ncbi:MAG TPA: hypothetical protein VIH25_13415 [Steroidobacteraceae bacterium]